jgi:two-component system, OmpR family, response regulator
MMGDMAEKTTILVIDDEPIVGDALKTVLSDCGYEVDVARTGREGLDKASRQLFDFTITDFRLPDMTGLDVLACLRNKGPRSAVIVITAYSTPEIVAESERLGALAVLAKPFFPADLLNLIQHAAEEKKANPDMSNAT